MKRRLNVLYCVAHDLFYVAQEMYQMGMELTAKYKTDSLEEAIRKDDATKLSSGIEFEMEDEWHRQEMPLQ